MYKWKRNHPIILFRIYFYVTLCIDCRGGMMPGKSAGRPKNQTHKQKMWFFSWIKAAKKSANAHSETNVENTPQNIILLETANNSVIYAVYVQIRQQCKQFNLVRKL